MNTYVILMRGINVGGKNKVPMIGLKKCLELQFQIPWTNLNHFWILASAGMDTVEVFVI